MPASPTLVFVAGIGGSGPEHWQSRWHARVPGSRWVEHSSWDEPVRSVWARELDDALARVDGPVVLVAHSLGCTLVTAWAAATPDSAVVGALLVAVPDVHGPQFPTSAQGFGDVAYGHLPFRAVVAASHDDPYASFGHSVDVAGSLGAELVDVGHKGHINASSGLGDWAEGWDLLVPLTDAGQRAALRS
ncbi:MAG: alpha/beta hydrolase [Brevundimonas sp.]